MVKIIVDDNLERAEYTGEWFAGILISATEESDNVTVRSMTLLNIRRFKHEVVQRLRTMADTLEAFDPGNEPTSGCDELNDRERNR